MRLEYLTEQPRENPREDMVEYPAEYLVDHLMENLTEDTVSSFGNRRRVFWGHATTYISPT